MEEKKMVGGGDAMERKTAEQRVEYLETMLESLAKFLNQRKENTEGKLTRETAVNAAIRSLYTIDERIEQSKKLPSNMGFGIIVECGGGTETFSVFVAKPDGSKGDEIHGVTGFEMLPIRGSEEPTLLEAKLTVYCATRLTFEAGLLTVDDTPWPPQPIVHDPCPKCGKPVAVDPNGNRICSDCDWEAIPCPKCKADTIEHPDGSHRLCPVCPWYEKSERSDPDGGTLTPDE